MNFEDMLKWSGAAMPAILLFNLLVTIAMTMTVYRLSRRQVAMEALKLVGSRWQEINREFIAKPSAQRVFDPQRFANKSDDDVILLNIVFQVINTCFEIHSAGANKLIDLKLRDVLFAGSAASLKAQHALVREILGKSASYPADFVASLLRTTAAC